jgi:hypothetical protein
VVDIIKTKIIRNLQSWLNYEKAEVQVLTLNESDNIRFAVHYNSCKYEIVQPKNKDFFIILGVVEVNEFCLNKLMSFKFTERNNFIQKLQNTFLLVPHLYYKFIWIDETQMHLKNIQLSSDMLFEEDLTRTKLFEILGFLKKLIIWSLLFIKEELGSEVEEIQENKIYL